MTIQTPHQFDWMRAPIYEPRPLPRKPRTNLKAYVFYGMCVLAVVIGVMCGLA